MLIGNIGKKALKLLHIFEHLSPTRDEKQRLAEYSPAIAAISKERHPELYPAEEEKKEEEPVRAVENEKYLDPAAKNDETNNEEAIQPPVAEITEAEVEKPKEEDKEP